MLEDFLEALSAAADPALPEAEGRIWDLTETHFTQSGFDKIIYIDAGPGQVVMRSNVSDAWVAHYHAQDYAQIDPFLSHCCATFRPISTGIAHADQHQGLSAAQMNLIDEASNFGINAGFSSTIRISGPRGVAGWNIASSLSRAEVAALRADREPTLRFAAHHAHDALVRARASVSAGLSPREIQCLHLLGRGARTKEIARALELSTAAVELYLRNARRKLGATTREQAIAIVTAKGLFKP